MIKIQITFENIRGKIYSFPLSKTTGRQFPSPLRSRRPCAYVTLAYYEKIVYIHNHDHFFSKHQCYYHFQFTQIYFIILYPSL